MPSVEIDHEACEGSRYCEQIAPQLFRVNDDEKAVLLVDEVPDEQRELLEEAERLALRDHPLIPIYFYVNKHLVKPEVDGWYDNVMNVVYTKDLGLHPANR